MKTPSPLRIHPHEDNKSDTLLPFVEAFCLLTRAEKSGVFARPNLKLFLFGALLLLVVQALISTGQSELTKAIYAGSADGSSRQSDINQLLVAAGEHPSFELFTRISQHYENIGDYRRAIRYLRMADKAESAEDL